MGPYFSGVDLIEIERFQRVLDRHGDRLLRRCFTDREVDYCRGRVPELAVRFAGKEATMKALGTGVRGISWREIEILANARGKPIVVLHGRALARAMAIGLDTLEISLTHERSMGCAFVVGGPSVTGLIGGPGAASGGLIGGPGAAGDAVFSGGPGAAGNRV